MADAAALRQHWPEPVRRRPIVIFGAGSITRDAHLPAYEKGGYEVAGIYDPDAAKVAALGHRAFASVAEAALVPGAVFDLATPPDAHAAILSQLPAGAAVLIQKPMGMDLAAATEILTICRHRKLLAAVNFQLRFAPMMLALRDAIDRGWLGAVVDVEMHGVMATPWHLWAFLEGLPRIEISMHSIHYLDSIRMLLGDPAGIHAKTLGHPAHRVAQTRSSAILDYGERARCTLSINHDWDFGKAHQACEMRIAGTHGAACLQLGVNLDYPMGRAAGHRADRRLPAGRPERGSGRAADGGKIRPAGLVACGRRRAVRICPASARAFHRPLQGAQRRLYGPVTARLFDPHQGGHSNPLQPSR